MPPSQSPRDRVEVFRGYVSALNRQFLDWCTGQWERKPALFWSSGMHDYLRHTAKIRREFQDILAEDEGADGNATPLGGASPTHASRPAKYEPQLLLMPISYSKTVHFIRHGEGFHNIGLNTPDSHLTQRGWEQALALGAHMRRHAPCAGVQLVVVSPMMRALETAAGVFGETLSEEQAAELGGRAGMEEDAAPGSGLSSPYASSPRPPLMLPQQGEKNVRTAWPGAGAREGVLYVCHEGCRERLGPSHCDRRRSRDAAAAAFPAVDFTLVECDEDPDWRAGKIEGESAVVARGLKFLQWLQTRPETNIAVVTHSAFLWFTLACFGNEYARPVRENLQRWYENAEMRTLVLSDGGGMGVHDSTWFAGGETISDPQRAYSEAPIVKA